MRVLLKFEIACDADAAWRALHSPAAVAELYGPLMQLRPLSQQPTSWQPGDDAVVRLRGAGIVPLGTQLIHVSEREVREHGTRVRILRDTGVPLTGPLASLDVWDHQMAVRPVPGNPRRTLWRDRLTFAGTAAPVLWPMLWSIWQWRQARIIASAPTWAFDPEPADQPETSPRP